MTLEKSIRRLRAKRGAKNARRIAIMRLAAQAEERR